MAITLGQRLDGIETKARLLLLKYMKLRKAKQESDSRIVRLLEQVEQQSREIADLRRQVEYLRLAGQLASGSGSVEKSRAVISSLVREIDKCIAELSSTTT